jgi:hypothetical protein
VLLRTPITLLVAGLLAVAFAYASVLLDLGSRSAAPWSLALGAVAVLTAMLQLGARRRRRIPRILGVTAAFVSVALAGGFAYALAAPAPSSDGPLLLGLPRVTAVLLLLAGLIPLVCLPAAYALAFDTEVLSDTDLSRVRDAAAARAAKVADG